MDELLDITKVLDKKLINVDLKSNTKEGVIAELSQMLAKESYLIDEKQFIADVMQREEEGLTGLGEGIAIPHGKSEGVQTTTIAIGKLSNGLEWGSLDDQPVHVIILFAVKDTDATTMHIKLLQKVAIMLADNNFLTSLREANTADEIYELILGR
ncbi:MULTISPECIES: PTS sugar transporter subunit IIA [Brochothrix]|uniref:PTS mannose transporter subunit IIAB n=1 Tax=Brochothrix thermosphacta TaxID=2756 RepID=A0A1D2KFL6_BROTH|nr:MULTISPECIES: PTS sugar transporter subunit IIA [Brochothrix]ANZ96446.1 PTS mannose transporter subunit IIAB [Brochothrix thermosphacta]ATF25868.1 PTS mannose transporter subunit IIAB [Brochothrix thermosphacta]ATH85204.1 PTS mannose transporter subunit IIAB [Brochothrix thermosphacta]MBR5525755.1 PTS sugar transporter subunit IIA [Brochothrix sp.]MPQ28579.1 PTS sugar transporter subunit IIA [Brochothrix thermosphacta]